MDKDTQFLRTDVEMILQDIQALTKRIVALETKKEPLTLQRSFAGNGFVSLNKAGISVGPEQGFNRTGVVGPDSNVKTILDYRAFIESLLDFSERGMNVTEEVRSAARKLLGR